MIWWWGSGLQLELTKPLTRALVRDIENSYPAASVMVTSLLREMNGQNPKGQWYGCRMMQSWSSQGFRECMWARTWPWAGPLATAWKKSLENDTGKMQEQTCNLWTDYQGCPVLLFFSIFNCTRNCTDYWCAHRWFATFLGHPGAGRDAFSNLRTVEFEDDGPIGLEIQWTAPPVVAAVVPGGAGEAALIQQGQAILDINGRQMLVTWCTAFNSRQNRLKPCYRFVWHHPYRAFFSHAVK